MTDELHAEHELATARLVERLATLVGEAASIESTSHGYYVEPRNPEALKLFISTDQSLLVQGGHLGGSWELNYDSDEDMQLAWDIVSAVVAGRVQERFGRRRSVVTITREDGSTKSETGFDGLLALLPQPGWKSSGRLVQYDPYC